MLSDALSLHERILIFTLDQNLNILDLSSAAELALGRSKKMVMHLPFWHFVQEDHKLKEAFLRHSNVSIFDHRIETRQGQVVHGDIHIGFRDDQYLLWIYQLGRSVHFERSDAARNASRLASSMAAVLAHEIRNPLGSIRGAAQLLSETVAPADRDLLAVINEEVNRIGRLVGEFEDLAGASPATIEAVNIHLLLDQVRRAALAGYGRGVVFEDRFDPSLPEIACERDRMLRVLHNIVKNACEAIYTRFGDRMDKGRILIQTRYRTGMHKVANGSLPVEISITDNGGGIPPELRDEIFKPFVTTKSKGTGLGLSIVARLVEEIGGAIEYENLSDGTQVRIYVSIYSETKNG